MLGEQSLPACTAFSQGVATLQRYVDDVDLFGECSSRARDPRHVSKRCQRRARNRPNFARELEAKIAIGYQLELRRASEPGDYGQIFEDLGPEHRGKI